MSIAKVLNWMIYGTLLVLSVGLVTSTSLLSLSHILMIIPSLYFLSQIDLKNISISSSALLGLAVVIILSIVLNQSIIVNGYKALPKVKYFLFGFLMVVPFQFYLKNHINRKKISYLLYLFCVATTVASIAGMIGMKTGYNYISMRTVNLDRNAGLSGMVLNYAHNLAFFQIILLGLIIYKYEVKNLINKNFLYIIFIINLIGLYTSFTRGAILALLVGVPFYFFKNNFKKFLSLSLILIILGLGVYTTSGQTILRPGSDKERISQWQAAFMAFKERPILGYGYLNFEKHSVSIKEKYDLGQLQFGGHAHNNFLEILATTGILGFIFFCTWLISWAIEMFKRDDIIARISLPFIVVFTVSGLTQSTISLGVNLFFIMAAYAIGQVNLNINVKNNA